MEHIKADIAVIGAGPAGVCAALAAARAGRQVVLAGNRPSLGGNSSSEVRVWTRGAVGAGNLFAEEMGIWGELKLRNLYANPDANPILWDEVLLDLCLAENTLTLLLNTHITGVTMEAGRVAAVQGWQLGSERSISIESHLFIDCTGDGSIGAQAGVPFRTGKEGRAEYGEKNAPPQPLPTTQGSSLLYYVKDAGHPVPFVAPAYAYSLEKVEALIGAGGRVVNELYGGSDYWWFEFGGTEDTIRSAQDITLELKRLVMGVWNYIKNSGKFPAESLTLEWVGNYPGKRESRRMVTGHVLTQNDIRGNTEFYDGAFYGGWYMDFHPAEGFLATDDSCEQIPVNVYEIPLRCLYNTKVENLFFAGRDIGATHAAFSSSRIMNTCALSGHAAGTAAAWCAAQGITNKGITPQAAGAIRQLLLGQDMLVLRERNTDEADLARSAAYTASESFSGSCGTPTGSIPVEADTFVTFPAAAGGVGLLARVSAATTLTGTWYAAPLPSRYRPGRALGTFTAKAAPGDCTEISLHPPEATGFLTLVLAENPAVEILTESAQRTGLLCGGRESSAYRYPCLTGDFSALYRAENLQTGYNRPWNGTNLWRPQGTGTLTLSWETPQAIREIRLFFNPDLSMEIPSSRAARWAPEHKFTARAGMPPCLTKRYTIEALTAAGWQTLVAENENWRRLAVHTLTAPAEATALRLTLQEAWQQGTPELFEIRVYA